MLFDYLARTLYALVIHRIYCAIVNKCIKAFTLVHTYTELREIIIMQSFHEKLNSCHLYIKLIRV